LGFGEQQLSYRLRYTCLSYVFEALLLINVGVLQTGYKFEYVAVIFWKRPESSEDNRSYEEPVEDGTSTPEVISPTAETSNVEIIMGKYSRVP